jgi:hypothetical protein
MSFQEGSSPELGASDAVGHDVFFSPATSVSPSDPNLGIQVYRRYSYSISAHNHSVAKVGPEYRVTWTVRTSGETHTVSADVSGSSASDYTNDAAELITDFRDWLLERLETGELDPRTALAYVNLYYYCAPENTPSFRYQLSQLLAACPATESSSDVDALVTACVGMLGYHNDS